MPGLLPNSKHNTQLLGHLKLKILGSSEELAGKWQHIGAYADLAAYYLVGIPAGVLCGFVFQLRGEGLCGKLTGSSTQTGRKRQSRLGRGYFREHLQMRMDCPEEATKYAIKANRCHFS
ncbi:hypothetical protein REPUB_Repub13aG0099600 [Reevesia pubescens]